MNMSEPTKCQNLFLHILGSFETLGTMKCRYRQELKENRKFLEVYEGMEEEDEDEDQDIPSVYSEERFWASFDFEFIDKMKEKRAELDKMKENIQKMQEHIAQSLKDFKTQGCFNP